MCVTSKLTPPAASLVKLLHYRRNASARVAAAGTAQDLVHPRPAAAHDQERGADERGANLVRVLG